MPEDPVGTVGDGVGDAGDRGDGARHLQVPRDAVGIGPGAARALGVRTTGAGLRIRIGVDASATALVLQLAQRVVLGLIEQPPFRRRIDHRGAGDGLRLATGQLAAANSIVNRGELLERAACLDEASGLGAGGAGLASEPVLRCAITVGSPHLGLRDLGRRPGLQTMAEPLDPLAHRDDVHERSRLQETEVEAREEATEALHGLLNRARILREVHACNSMRPPLTCNRQHWKGWKHHQHRQHQPHQPHRRPWAPRRSGPSWCQQPNRPTDSEGTCAAS